MSKNRIARGLRLILCGAFAVQVAGCTVEDIQQQFANGLSTALTGLFRISAENVANEFFNVDD